MSLRQCRRCLGPFVVDDARFVTCPGCRLYDVPQEGEVRGCTRFKYAGNGFKASEVPNPSDDNARRCREDG